MRKSGFTLLEATVVVVISAIVLGAGMRIFSNSSKVSEKINEQQMMDQESRRLFAILQADCRSAKTIQAQGEALEIVRFGFDKANNIQETVVSYVFVDGNMTRQENGNTKTFEFKRWQKKISNLGGPEKVPDLECSFTLASPAVLCLKVVEKTSKKSIIDERLMYETTSK